MMIDSPELENRDNPSCCCIDHPLFESFKEADATPIPAIIGQAGTNWGKASFVSIINHIIFDHHLFLRTELPVLSECITIINHAHGGKYPELLVLHRLFHSMKDELEKHLIEEEEQTFPYITDYEKSEASESLRQAKQSIEILEIDHSFVRSMLKEIRETTSDYKLPMDACPVAVLAYDKLQQLEAKLIEHIQVENNILFSRVKAIS